MLRHHHGNDSLDESRSGHTLTRALVSFLELRHKTLPSIGPLEKVRQYFDSYIEVDSELRRYPMRDYDDAYPDVKRLQTLHELEEFLAENEFQVIFIAGIRSIREYATLGSLLECTAAEIHVGANKTMTRYPLQVASPKHVGAYIAMRVFAEVRRKKAPLALQRHSIPVASLMTNSHLNARPLLKHFSPKRIIKVRHQDAVPHYHETVNRKRGRVESKSNFGVFLDTYQPFHTEQYDLRGLPTVTVQPEAYYALLKSYLNQVMMLFDLEEIEIARHPNSIGEELQYLKGFRTSYGNTAERVRLSRMAFSHISNSTSFAIQYARPVTLVNFTTAFSDELQKQIRQRSKSQGFTLHHFDGQSIRIAPRPWLTSRLKTLLFKYFLSPAAPSPVEWLEARS